MSLQLQLDRRIPEGFENLISETVWGTEKGTRYVQTDFKDRLKQIENPYCLYLKRNNKLLATILLYGSIPENQSTQAYYVRYFSFLSGYQTKASTTHKKKANSALRDEIQKIFKAGSLDGNRSSALFYAYVELENHRSREMSRNFDFEPIRRFETTVFSRFSPKTSHGFRKARREETPLIKQILKEFYREYTFYKSSRLSEESYYVMEVDGEMVAGVQALPAHWIIKELPGLAGKIIMSTVHRIPYFRRIFNPKAYNFLGLDQVFFQPGAENSLAPLFESVCAEMGSHSALLWSDTESKLNKVIKNIPLGPMNKLKKDVPVDIIVNFANLDTEAVSTYKKQPAYIDAFDLT